jgi:pterin-4a-carbinolamine dehydratase
MADEGVWRQEGESLVRDYKSADLAEAMAFVNRVAGAAERPTTIRTSSSTGGTTCA